MAQRWLKAFVCLLFTIPCSLFLGQGGAITGQVITSFGYPAANVPVRVCPYSSTGNPCTPLANIYSDPLLVNQISNPTATDTYGNYSIFAGVGYYIVQITPQPGTTYSYLVSSSGSASVYSVGLTMPSIFTVANSPITTGGVMGVTLANETVNTVFAGPGSGGSAAPAFRSLVLADLPPIAASNLTNGVTGTGAIVLANNPALVAPAIGAATGTSLVLTGTATAATVNATSGFEVNGVALSASNLSNGTSGTGAVCLASGSSCAASSAGFYQTVASNGAAQTQRPTLNFSPYFTVTDSASPAETTISLNAPGTGAYLATYASLPGASTACAQYDGNGNLVPAGTPCVLAVAQKNCLSVACAGGSTYVSGTTYTNSSGIPVLEEVTASYGTYGATGCDYALVAVVSGITVGSNGIHNACGGQFTDTFLVPIGASFSATITHQSGGTAAYTISSWLELTL